MWGTAEGGKGRTKRQRSDEQCHTFLKKSAKKAAPYGAALGFTC